MIDPEFGSLVPSSLRRDPIPHEADFLTSEIPLREVVDERHRGRGAVAAKGDVDVKFTVVGESEEVYDVGAGHDQLTMGEGDGEEGRMG